MLEIWKFELPLQDRSKIDMPADAKILSVQVQRGLPHVWAMVDPERETEGRRFRLAGTGHRLENESLLRYIGTFQLEDGRFIGHLFEMVSPING